MLGNKSCKASNYLKLIILISIFVITTVVAVSCDKKGRPTGKEEPDVTKEPESDDLVPSGNLDPSEDAFESLDPNQPIFGSLVLVRDNQLFYKKGSSKNYSIVSKNLTTQEENEIVTVELPYSDVGNFCLKGDYIYYDRDDRLHKVSLDGSNDTKLYKRKADLLGFYGDDVIVFDKSSYSLIRINNDGEYKTLLKKGYFYMEATVMAEGIYYILPSSEKKDEPSVQLYYMDFEGNNKTLLLEDREVFHLKSNNNEAFFIARDSHKFKIYKVKDKKLDIIYNINREDLEALGYRWDFLLPTGVYLLGVTSTHVYYGVEFDADGKEALHVYSVKTDGSGHELFYIPSDMEELNPAAYFSRGSIDNGYLKILFDCDTNPPETLYINLQDKSFMLFDGAYHLAMDVEGDYVYYLKSSEYDSGELTPEIEYKYQESKISDLLNERISK